MPLLRPPKPIPFPTNLKVGKHPSAWVLDENQRPIGWIDRANLNGWGSVKELTVQEIAEEMSVMNNDTLHDALSRMLGLGFKSLPVVNESGHFIGEVTLGDVEQATARTENTNHV